MKEGSASSGQKRDKAKKFQDVSLAIFRILLQGGPQNVTHTSVARLSKVSRPWIYKYIGKDPDDLIAFCLDTIGKAFAKMEGVTRQASAAEFRESLKQGTWRMLSDAALEPALLLIYYRYAGTQNPIGEKVRELEDLYLRTVEARLRKFMGLSEREARAASETLQGLRMGLAHRSATTNLTKDFSVGELSAALRTIANVLEWTSP